MKNIILSFSAFLLFAHLSLSDVAAKEPITIVALGDSLVAGYNLPKADAFPAQLEKALIKKGHNVKVFDAGVSGDTAAAGLTRVDWAVPEGTHAVIVELGANDALRGIDPKETFKALDALLQRLKEKNTVILLAGMKGPRSYGPEYKEAFETMYPTLAKKHNTLLYPFFLDGVALNPKLNLEDGIHPNKQGVAVIVERILPFVEDLIKQAKTK